MSIKNKVKKKRKKKQKTLWPAEENNNKKGEAERLEQSGQETSCVGTGWVWWLNEEPGKTMETKHLTRNLMLNPP